MTVAAGTMMSEDEKMVTPNEKLWRWSSWINSDVCVFVLQKQPTEWFCSHPVTRGHWEVLQTYLVSPKHFLRSVVLLAHFCSELRYAHTYTQAEISGQTCKLCPFLPQLSSLELGSSKVPLAAGLQNGLSSQCWAPLHSVCLWGGGWGIWRAANRMEAYFLSVCNDVIVKPLLMGDENCNIPLIKIRHVSASSEQKVRDH